MDYLNNYFIILQFLIENCTFDNNTATGTNGGGAVKTLANETKITNSTFTGNQNGGLCVENNDSGGATVIVNYCTFATDTDSIYVNGNLNNLTVKNSIIRTIIGSGTITPDNNITITSALTSKDVKDKNGKVTHTVFRKYSELSAAVDKGNDNSVTVDQLGNTVTVASHDIGAAEIDIPTVTVSFTSAPTAMTVSQDSTDTAKFTATATAKYSDGKEQTLTPVLKLESNCDWITFDASTGTLTAKPTADINAGDYSVKITATASQDSITASQDVSMTITVAKKPASKPTVRNCKIIK